MKNLLVQFSQMSDRIEVSAFVDLLVNYNNIDKVKFYLLALYTVSLVLSKGITTHMHAGYVGAFYRTLKISVKCY